MTTPFIGMIVAFAGNFAPRGWALCNGQTLQIAQSQALFAVIGTTYGGDGVRTFQLPNLQGRRIVHAGSTPGLSPYTIGQVGGAESVTLTSQQMPMHNHTVTAQGAGGTATSPSGAYPAQDGSGKPAIPIYASGSPSPAVTMATGMIGQAGGSQPAPVLDPYLCVNYIIALEGTFPSRN
jgi:microcystin-dependent protein